jgi:glycopeptide antibiotics resistance protein
MSNIERRKLGLVLVVFTLVIAFVATQWPFDYHLTRFGIARRWARVDWSWFPRDYRGDIRFDRDFALNLVMLLPLGAGFGLWRRAATLRVIVESLVLGTVTSVLLEVAQLVTHHRFTAFPDVWRNALGCTVGCILAIWIDRTTRPRDPMA